VNAGSTIAQIADATGRSKATVRHWLGRYGLKTMASRRIEGQRSARDAGLSVVTLKCRHHGATEFVIDAGGGYRCRRCRVESVTTRRRKVKEVLVAEAGGCCAICGYSSYMGALQFHHVDPTRKVLPVSMAGVTRAIDVLREEARKCVLLCANCHAEVEGGVVRLAIQ
jgi:hypothetical protein